MTKRKLGKLPIAAAVLCAAVAFAVLLNSVISFGATNIFTENGGAISISFDKAKMKTVDRAVLSDGKKTVEITDLALIKSLVQETMVATHAGFGCSRDRTIKLYSGNTLIRSMIWSTCCGHVRVYTADATHWILSGYEGGDGFAFLPYSLETQLNELLGQP